MNNTEIIEEFLEKVKQKYLGVHPNELYNKFSPKEIVDDVTEIAKELIKKYE